MANPQDTPEESYALPVERGRVDAQGNPIAPEPQSETMQAMASVTEEEMLKEGESVPPPIEPPKVKQPATINPPEPITAVMASMGEEAERFANLTKGGQPKEHTAYQKRHGIPGPWRAPAPQLDVMRDMGEAAEEAKPAPKQAGGMPAGDVDRMNFAGAELEHVMAQRVAGLVEQVGRLLKTQTDVMRTLAEMAADHERKIHDIQGFLERSRT